MPQALLQRWPFCHWRRFLTNFLGCIHFSMSAFKIFRYFETLYQEVLQVVSLCCYPLSQLFFMDMGHSFQSDTVANLLPYERSDRKRSWTPFAQQPVAWALRLHLGRCFFAPDVHDRDEKLQQLIWFLYLYIYIYII